MTKAALLQTLRAHRDRWDALLDSVGADRMLEPGVTGRWSVKDVISHVTAYERWLVDWLTAAAQHKFPQPSPLDDADIQRRNERVYQLSRALPLHEVTRDARATFGALLKSVEQLPEEYVTDPKAAEWFMTPYWGSVKTVPEAVMNLSAEHYAQHAPAIERWAARRSRPPDTP